jgi:hypothetical protein
MTTKEENQKSSCPECDANWPLCERHEAEYNEECAARVVQEAIADLARSLWALSALLRSHWGPPPWVG